MNRFKTWYITVNNELQNDIDRQNGDMSHGFVFFFVCYLALGCVCFPMPKYKYREDTQSNSYFSDSSKIYLSKNLS